MGRDCFVSDFQIKSRQILYQRRSNRSNSVIQCNWLKFRKEVERFLQLFFAVRTSGWMGWVLQTLIFPINEGSEILVALFESSTQLTELNFHPSLTLTHRRCCDSWFINNKSRSGEHEKNYSLTNHPIIFVFSENEFEKIENHSFYLNISSESNKELGVAAFQRKLIELKTKERLMKEYSTHWIGNYGMLA